MYNHGSGRILSLSLRLAADSTFEDGKENGYRFTFCVTHFAFHIL